MQNSKKSKQKIRILELVIFCLLIIVSRLIYVGFVREANLHKVLNDHVEAEPQRVDAETYANQQYQDNLALRKKLNKLQTENNINAITTTLPNYTKSMEDNLDKVFNNFYKVGENFSVQRTIINNQNIQIQPFFQGEFDGLKGYRSVVDSINFSYQVVNGKLLTTVIVKTTQISKKKLTTTKNTAIRLAHVWQFHFDFRKMKIDEVLEVFSGNLLTTDK